jgi:hypothetical protein
MRRLHGITNPEESQINSEEINSEEINSEEEIAALSIETPMNLDENSK